MSGDDQINNVHFVTLKYKGVSKKKPVYQCPKCKHEVAYWYTKQEREAQNLDQICFNKNGSLHHCGEEEPKKGESSTDKPSSSGAPSGSPSTPPPLSTSETPVKPTELNVFAQEMYKDMDALRTDIQQIKKVLEKIAEKLIPVGAK